MFIIILGDEKMFTNKKINDIYEVIKMLKNHSVLYTLEPKTLYFYKNEKIFITNENVNITLNINDFIDSFSNLTFYEYELNDENFDFERDIEYYNFKHK